MNSFLLFKFIIIFFFSLKFSFKFYSFFVFKERKILLNRIDLLQKELENKDKEHKLSFIEMENRLKREKKKQFIEEQNIIKASENKFQHSMTMVEEVEEEISYYKNLCAQMQDKLQNIDTHHEKDVEKIKSKQKEVIKLHLLFKLI